jgi:hypothetical protein
MQNSNIIEATLGLFPSRKIDLPPSNHTLSFKIKAIADGGSTFISSLKEIVIWKKAVEVPTLKNITVVP